MIGETDGNDTRGDTVSRKIPIPADEIWRGETIRRPGLG
jgi:hypothetical protein